MESPVLVGRIRIRYTAGLAFHYGVKVGETWYEIDGKDKASGINRIVVNEGNLAENEQSMRGATIVGTTKKTDDDINKFLETWVLENPTYNCMSSNCQKFSYEFVVYLTDDIFRWPFNLEAATIKHLSDHSKPLRIVRDGIKLLRFGTHRFDGMTGPLNRSHTGPYAQFLTVGREREVGAWADLNLVQRGGGLTKYVGGHVGLNANTGIGMRNGNLDVHVLGFGFKMGVDGVEVNTPVVGVNTCVIS